MRLLLIWKYEIISYKYEGDKSPILKGKYTEPQEL